MDNNDRNEDKDSISASETNWRDDYEYETTNDLDCSDDDDCPYDSGEDTPKYDDNRARIADYYANIESIIKR